MMLQMQMDKHGKDIDKISQQNNGHYLDPNVDPFEAGGDKNGSFGIGGNKVEDFGFFSQN